MNGKDRHDRRIAVGADGSPSSITALRWGMGQAKPTGCEVEAVTARRYPSTYGFAPAVDGAMDFEGDAAEVLHFHPVSGQSWQPAVSSEMGDVEAGAAATRVRATYATACRAHVPPEARTAVAEWDNGRLTVWTGTNAPFAVRAQLSNTFRISEAAIRVIVPPVGGDFGGSHGEETIEAAWLARVTFRPVMVHWSDSAAVASRRCSGEA